MCAKRKMQDARGILAASPLVSSPLPDRGNLLAAASRQGDERASPRRATQGSNPPSGFARRFWRAVKRLRIGAGGTTSGTP
jgi:hypothetical protein